MLSNYPTKVMRVIGVVVVVVVAVEAIYIGPTCVLLDIPTLECLLQWRGNATHTLVFYIAIGTTSYFYV